MKVSFIIPALNEETLLTSCILAISQAVYVYERERGGEKLVCEIIVVDNGSTDDTAGLAESLGARVVECHTPGVTRARQAGMKAALYEIHAYVDADNRVPGHWLENFAALTDDPDCVAITGPVWFDKQSLGVRALATCFLLIQQAAHHLIGASLQGGNFALKHEALVSAGGMSVDIDFYGEDTDLGLRLSRIGKVKFLHSMWCNSSARRFNQSGYVHTAWLYSINYLSIHWLGRPWTKTHVDYRT